MPPLVLTLKIIGLVLLGIGAGYAMWRRWARIREWIERTYPNSRFYEVLKTASGEIAVLLFVFPLIDQFGKADGKDKFNWPVVVWSFVIGIVFIGVAGYFARKEHDAGKEENE